MSRRKPSTPGIEVCELTGPAADKVIEDANSDLMPLEPRRRVVSFEQQMRMAEMRKEPTYDQWKADLTAEEERRWGVQS